MNPARGEVSVPIDGQPHALCLTLGALAEMLDALDCVSLGALAARLGTMTPQDGTIVLGALLRGAGEAQQAGLLSCETEIAARIGWPVAAHAIARAFEAALEAG